MSRQQLLLIGGLLLFVIFALVMSQLSKKDKDKKSGGLITTYKEMFLSESTLTFGKAMLLKLVIFLVVLVYVYGMKLTNINFYTDQVFNRFDIAQDLIYSNSKEPRSEETAMAQELDAFNAMLTTVYPNRQEFLATDMTFVMMSVDTYVQDNNIKTELEDDTFQNKVYHRLLMYYEARVWNHVTYFALAVAFSMLLEVWLFMQTAARKAEDRNNVVFLKKIFVLSGTLNKLPADNLKAMMEKARPNILKELNRIYDAMQKHDVPLRTAMVTIAKEQNDKFTRMFFEKLTEAYTGDFDKAVVSVQKEIVYERNDIKRKVGKKVVSINTLGQTLFLIMLAVLMIYFFVPWLELMKVTNGAL